MPPLKTFGGPEPHPERMPQWERRADDTALDAEWAALTTGERKRIDAALRRGERLTHREQLGLWRARRLAGPSSSLGRIGLALGRGMGGLGLAFSDTPWLRVVGVAVIVGLSTLELWIRRGPRRAVKANQLDG